ncbi:MAG: gamma-glutamylcyclotransferase [Rhodospirillaceae bacterium]|jgi:glutathione-specific gamma-glutamylcyclotransferase|nr:gamma-glutamylcyclotransferase [Rhodospirillaceae bacterium]MBT5458276.1 gamma-glutamylcyclotransferase [Rhodospirillaceae bacterium]
MNQRTEIIVEEPGDVWFFAYGSLMWDPGFVPAEIRPALLRGWHRRFCVASVIYRGTPAEPGLSLGLDRGGSCRGRALRIAAADREAVFAYLAEREMPEEIYSCRKIRLEMNIGPATAYTLVVNRDHDLYVGALDHEAMAARIARCAGQRGPNRDYLEQTVRHLDDLGISDGLLHRLLDRVTILASRQA